MEEYITIPKSKLLELREAIDKYRYLLKRLKKDLIALEIETKNKTRKN